MGARLLNTYFRNLTYLKGREPCYRQAIFTVLAAMLPEAGLVLMDKYGRYQQKLVDELPDQQTADLMAAAYLADTANFTHLLHGCNASLQMSKGYTALPIFAAALGGNLNEARTLLQAYGPNALDCIPYRSPLHLAAMGGNVEVIQLLLAHGANAIEKDYKQYTPLHLAAICGQADAAGALLSTTGVAFGPLDESRHTPLGFAIRLGHDDVVEEFENSRNPGILWDTCAFQSTCTLEDNFNNCVVEEMTAIDYAAFLGRERIFNRIFAYQGYDCYIDETFIVMAMRGGNVAIVEAILQSIPNALEICTSTLEHYRKGTALSEAAGWGNEELVRFLLSISSESPRNISDNEGKMALFRAIKGSSHLGTVKVLLNYPGIDQGSTPALLWAIENTPPSVEIVEELLDHPHIDPNTKNEFGRTALFEIFAEPEYSKKHFVFDVARVLLARESVNKHVIDRDGNSALLYTAKNSHIGFELLLPFFKDNIWHCNFKGQNALDLAVAGGQLPVVKRLLEPVHQVTKEAVEQALKAAHSLYDFYCNTKTSYLQAGGNSAAAVFQLIMGVFAFQWIIDWLRECLEMMPC
ncbi:ankyrin repeat domain-containing protein [Aspergillus mulundensis]|uniref:Ankyrin repeat protein n=1 Tax=Aspergillus mulundensis TaxID=1810919 RepID=A0A3D8SCN2_9EURO|nr:hypothetical protein DSM5745_04421 [Aspergillus mulundensis]RDW84095.1 hypothetical protein DSM5745_04421 [Aspergillus mulundensis]